MSVQAKRTPEHNNDEEHEEHRAHCPAHAAKRAKHVWLDINLQAL